MERKNIFIYDRENQNGKIGSQYGLALKWALGEC